MFFSFATEIRDGVTPVSKLRFRKTWRVFLNSP